MLVLTRRNQERIVLNPGLPSEIVITICDIAGAKVRVGILAPQDVKIYRSELLLQPKEATDDTRS